MAERTAAAVLRDARDTLETALWGLADLNGSDPRRRVSGLRNLVVFGRSVTNVLQNLRTVVGAEAFDEWYLPIQARMREDELLKYFYKLRTVILREGTTGSRLMVSVKMNTNDLEPLMRNPPPGATGFFFGDRLGGSGWEVDLPDGTKAVYYVALPPELGVSVQLHFPDAPSTHKGEPITETSIPALGQLYLEYLSELLSEAEARFAH